jgi:hypothetical protein
MLGVKARRLQCGNWQRCWRRGTLPIGAIDLWPTIDDIKRKFVCSAFGLRSGLRGMLTA